MITNLRRLSQKGSWQTKLILSGSVAIFLTFSLFSLLEYNSVSKWMLTREELIVKKTIADITTYYKGQGKILTEDDIRDSNQFIKKMNDKDQLIRIYTVKGKILVSDKNGVFPVLEPAPVTKQKLEKITTEDNEAIVAKYPLKVNGFTGTIEIVRELNSYQKMMDHLSVVMLGFGVAAILFSALCGFFLAKQLLRPIRNLADTMKSIKETGFQGRMDVYKQKDELSDLSILFNEMMDQIEHSFIHQKQFIEDASHELRTPVSILEGHLSLLNRWGKKDPAILDESLNASLYEVSRLKKLVVDLLELTRAENLRTSMALEIVDIEQMLQKLVKNLGMIHPDFQFDLKVGHPLRMIWIIEQHLQQILIILLDNAIKYSGENNKIQIIAKQSKHETILVVEDFGIGIPKEHVSDVFNRFYRVDKARSRENGGTGLGLSIAKRIISKYNGDIIIESQEGKGTKVTVILPDHDFAKF
ncbi:cell wall metabolism sensor histidine kinase WalK [Bacillus sp. EB600]|uniref:sensor histidine kinase n=1 Tax=Bacillus sp. EB600 TaxID=2806345 RepID=UPI00210E2AE1|nr:ATP-binding protein [Bacillus sp. EB600]MCQ6277750.1 HAMP domain-containing protein [Bacillus sp. EB600]